MKGGPKSSFRPFLHQALQLKVECTAIQRREYFMVLHIILDSWLTITTEENIAKENCKTRL